MTIWIPFPVLLINSFQWTALGGLSYFVFIVILNHIFQWNQYYIGSMMVLNHMLLISSLVSKFFAQLLHGKESILIELMGHKSLKYVIYDPFELMTQFPLNHLNIYGRMRYDIHIVLQLLDKVMVLPKFFYLWNLYN